MASVRTLAANAKLVMKPLAQFKAALLGTTVEDAEVDA